MPRPRPPLRPVDALSSGMRVAVVAPSGPVDAGRLEIGCDVLRSWDLDVVLGAHVLDRHPHGFLAGTDVDRASDLQWAWCDPEIDAIVCARGGYGAVRMLEHLNWDAMGRAVGGRVKPFVGSSDITVLHLAFAHHLGVSTLSGPMVAGTVLGIADSRPESADSLRRALFAPHEGQILSGGAALIPGMAEGRITGGTLTLLAGLAGTPELGDARGAVVLLEDVDENPYRIDRLLTQLLRTSWFDGVAAIACGGWEKCGDPAAVDAVLIDRLGPLGVPVVTRLPFGHGEVQLTVPMGVRATLDAENGTLHLSGAAGWA